LENLFELLCLNLI